MSVVVLVLWLIVYSVNVPANVIPVRCYDTISDFHFFFTQNLLCAINCFTFSYRADVA